jgi:hypothetical protein
MPLFQYTDLIFSADNNFQFGNVSASIGSQVINIPASSFGSSHFYVNEAAGRPLTIRVGDFNLDGYPDLLIPLVDSSNVSRIELWQNTGSGLSRTFERVNAVGANLGLLNVMINILFLRVKTPSLIYKMHMPLHFWISMKMVY